MRKLIVLAVLLFVIAVPVKAQDYVATEAPDEARPEIEAHLSLVMRCISDIPSQPFLPFLLELMRNANEDEVTRLFYLIGDLLSLYPEELTELIGMSDRLLILKDGQLAGEFLHSQGIDENQIINVMI